MYKEKCSTYQSLLSVIHYKKQRFKSGALGVAVITSRQLAHQIDASLMGRMYILHGC